MITDDDILECLTEGDYAHVEPETFFVNGFGNLALLNSTDNVPIEMFTFFLSSTVSFQLIHFKSITLICYYLCISNNLQYINHNSNTFNCLVRICSIMHRKNLKKSHFFNNNY